MLSYSPAVPSHHFTESGWHRPVISSTQARSFSCLIAILTYLIFLNVLLSHSGVNTGISRSLVLCARPSGRIAAGDWPGFLTRRLLRTPMRNAGQGGWWQPSRKPVFPAAGCPVRGHKAGHYVILNISFKLAIGVMAGQVMSTSSGRLKGPRH